MLTRDIHTFSMAPVLTIAASNFASFFGNIFSTSGAWESNFRRHVYIGISAEYTNTMDTEIRNMTKQSKTNSPMKLANISAGTPRGVYKFKYLYKINLLSRLFVIFLYFFSFFSLFLFFSLYSYFFSFFLLFSLFLFFLFFSLLLQKYLNFLSKGVPGRIILR